MSSRVEGWLGVRMDDVPGALGPWLEPSEGASGDEVAPELIRRGLRALADAADRPGRNREGAFRLLAADAYLTWACEALLEGSDPERDLEELVGRIPSEFG